ncbi:MAG: WYL domain-containing protein [bacterium]|nr:WYL domain-containing protein [bacterium]
MIPKASILALADADGLRPTTVDIEWGSLQANWDQQFRHQLPKLPDLAGFKDGLLDALAWWLDPTKAPAAPAPLPVTETELVMPRVHFPRRRLAGAYRGDYLDDAIRFAARNHLLARFHYHGYERTVEPYSLRRCATGNLLLYAFERGKNGSSTNDIRAYKVHEIEHAEILDISFVPQWALEL